MDLNKPTLEHYRLLVKRADDTFADGCIRTKDSVLAIGGDITNDVRIKLDEAEPKMCRIEIDQRSKVGRCGEILY